MNVSLFKKAVLFLLLIFGFSTISGQSIQLSEDAKVSVLTCGTGNESYSLFGHTAVRIKDMVNFVDAVYNYGAFDFRTPNFVAKFAKGDLQYFAVVHPYDHFIREYTYERRSVEEQELNIPLDLKQKLFDNLNTSLASEESHYTYKFIDKNCTSMVVDIINKTLDTTAIVKNNNTDITYRTILYPYFDHHFYEKLGTSIIFGKKVDELGTKIFLPFELQKSLKTVQYKKQALAEENKTILSFNEIPPSSWWNNVYTYIIFLALILLLNKKGINLFYFTMMGLLGVFFIFMGFYSYHREVEYNYNILLFNPTLILLGYFYYSKNAKWIYNLAIFNLFSLLVYLIVLINKAHLLIVLPLIITSVILLVKMVKKYKKS